MVDVIIPVYKGLQQTRACIESVLRYGQSTPIEIVVIDDASPEPAIGACLREFAGRERITLLRNEENRGFVHSVNRGMSLHPDRDVVLLNSDTEVANDWLDRLRSCAHGAADIGTVTPFSNNATICSYPFEGWTGGVPGTLGLAALDRIFAGTNAARAVDLPTAVGFCMYVRRDCLQRTGLFDEQRFGRGYGEENDFCMRAAKSGWRNVLAADVFVFHEGAVSFSEERFALMRAASQVLLDAHPDYLEKVRQFIVADPARPFRSAIDDARIAHGVEEARQTLDERRQEASRLLARARELEKVITHRDADIRGLHESLAHAVDDKTQSAARLAECKEHLAKLQNELRHAEALASEGARELERLHASFAGRHLRFLMR